MWPRTARYVLSLIGLRLNQRMRSNNWRCSKTRRHEVQKKCASELVDKFKLIRRIRFRMLDYFIVVLALIKYYITKRNFVIDVAINVDGIWFKSIDIESIFILSPRYESWMWKYLQLKRGDVFIDVGAHCGKYTLKAARIVGPEGRVISIEPDQDTFYCLRDGIKMNRFRNVLPFKDFIFKFLESMNYAIKQIESNKFYFYCEPRN